MPRSQCRDSLTEHYRKGHGRAGSPAGQPRWVLDPPVKSRASWACHNHADRVACLTSHSASFSQLLICRLDRGAKRSELIFDGGLVTVGTDAVTELSFGMIGDIALYSLPVV